MSNIEVTFCNVAFAAILSSHLSALTSHYHEVNS